MNGEGRRDDLPANLPACQLDDPVEEPELDDDPSTALPAVHERQRRPSLAQGY
jgi:hypothetical protein